jgi:hypothetical protein
VERIGLRLQLRKHQAEAGDIVLLYGDESEALTHPYLARAWARSGADLRVPAPGQAKKVAMLGSLDHVTRQLIVHTSPTKRSTDFVAHLFSSLVSPASPSWRNGSAPAPSSSRPVLGRRSAVY